MNQHIQESLLKLATGESDCLDEDPGASVSNLPDNTKYVVSSSGASADVHSSTHLLSRYCQVGIYFDSRYGV